jgi:hypothetical protein
MSAHERQSHVMPPLIDMIGQAIGRYVVVEHAPRRGSTARAWWWTLCTGCGEQYAIPGNRLRKMQRDPGAMWRCERCD